MRKKNKITKHAQECMKDARAHGDIRTSGNLTGSCTTDARGGAQFLEPSACQCRGSSSVEFEDAVGKWLLQQRAAATEDVTARAPVMAKPNKAKPKIIESPDQKELLEAWSSSARQLWEMIATVRKNISETHIFCQAFPYIIGGFPEDIGQHFRDKLHEGKSVASDCADLYDAENVQGRVWTSVSEVKARTAALDKSCKNLKATHKWLKKDVFDHICAASRVKGKQQQVAPD